MLLSDCVLSADLISMAPFERTDPEENWVAARASGIIPGPLFEIYCKAGYLSFGAAPLFLKDNDNILFSYFSLVLRSVMESLQDADEQLQAFKEAQARVYDPGKRIRGEPWDPGADARARRNFKELLNALQTSLDSLADVIAIFLPGLIPGLSVGRAQFSRVENWAKVSLPPLSALLISPADHFLRELHTKLQPLAKSPPPESDWLGFMRILRNKAAHLGQPLFRQVGLQDKTGHFYAFIPRQWPFIWERHIKTTGTEDPSFFPTLLEEGLIHQDIVSFAHGLKTKVSEMIGAGISVISDAYDQFRGFQFNQPALAELESNSVASAFEYFVKSA